jgi:hypothetical protein
MSVLLQVRAGASSWQLWSAGNDHSSGPPRIRESVLKTSKLAREHCGDGEVSAVLIPSPSHTDVKTALALWMQGNDGEVSCLCPELAPRHTVVVFAQRYWPSLECTVDLGHADSSRSRGGCSLRIGVDVLKALG